MNKNILPQVMVLEFEPAISCSHWVDYIPRNRTRSGLIDDLRKQIIRGQIIGYRLLSVECEVIGNVPKEKDQS